MFPSDSSLGLIEAAAADLVRDLDPSEWSGEEAISVYDRLVRIERLAAAALAIVGAQVETTGAWKAQRSGARDAVGFLAARSGTTRARARDGLTVVAALPAAPALAQAFRAGQLSIDQAADIAAVLTQHPEHESELVDLATRVTRRRLKARCIEILAQGQGAEEQHQRAKAERSVSASVGRDGIWRMSARLPIIDGALIDKALDHFQTQAFDTARQTGQHEPYDAYRADALTAMALTAMGHGILGPHPHGNADHTTIDQDSTDLGSGLDQDHTSDHTDPDAQLGPNVESETDQDHSDQTGPTRKRKRKRRGRRTPSSSIRHAIVITVPHTAFGPTGLGQGETCQIPGIGPVPVSVVHQLLETDPIIKAVVTRGHDITTVATLTRTIKEDLRVAVLAAHQHQCSVPGCDNLRFLELDHHHEYAKGGPTSFNNLRPLCSYHHQQRTRHGYDLTGQPGNYQWLDPQGHLITTDTT